MNQIKSEIRKDYLLDKYSIITPSRAKRPKDVDNCATKKSICPFCFDSISSEKICLALPNNENWQAISVENAFPAITQNNKKAFGHQEVIIETPEHGKQLADLTVGQIKNVLLVYSQRSLEIAKINKINYILCFKNHGATAGASLSHSHSQIFASELTPPDLLKEAEAARLYKEKNHTCVYCDIIKKEGHSSRKIFSDNFMISIAPYASSYHYEAWIFPKRHVDNISLLNDSELESLAAMLKKILLKLKKLDLSYNFFLHNVISNTDQHFYLKIQPRASVWAGVELGSGLVINSLPPEQAAKFYRGLVE